MTELEEFVRKQRTEISEMYSRGIEWLGQSGIRNPDGGYKSEYNSKSREYRVWGGGRDCTLNTAGAILALLSDSSYKDLAMISAEHLTDTIIREEGQFDGTIPAGLDSRLIYPNYIGWAILALCAVYRSSNRNEFLEASCGLADWVNRNVMSRNGKIVDVIEMGRGGFTHRITEAVNRSYTTWHSVLIPAMVEVSHLAENTTYDSFINQLIQWMKNAQLEHGSIRFQYWGGVSRVYQILKRGRIGLLRSGWDEKHHPTAAVVCLQAFLIKGERERATKLLNWLKSSIGEGGLFYQYYWDGLHSEEEDVMPTVYLCNLLQEMSIADAEQFTMGTLKALRRTQIADKDPSAHGAFPGLPGHPTLGKSAFCWDTEFALLFLQKLLTKVS